VSVVDDGEDWNEIDLGFSNEGDGRLTDGWLTTDEFEDAKISLISLRDALTHVQSETGYWKWAILLPILPYRARAFAF